MNFMAWNCRGTAAKGFSGLLKDLRREYSASLMFLLETHSSGPNCLKQVKKTGFSGQFVVEARGHSGGIWCLWEVSLWKVEVLESSNQFAHLRVTWKGHITWVITVVYASPRFAQRQEVWDDLARLAETTSEAWVILGDFNSILAEHERRGGSSNFSIRGMQSFRRMMQECDLLDMGFQGSPFTWKHGNLFQRLDRVLCNLQWRMRFQSAIVVHLPFSSRIIG